MKIRLIIEIERELKAKLKGKAYSNGKTMQDIVVALIEGWINENTVS